MCEAARQLKKASHEIDLQKGNGAWNLARIQAILNEPHDCHHNEKEDTYV